MLKLKIDKLLSYGYGRQLLWLFVLTIICMALSIAVARFIIQDDFLSWQYIIGLFLDPGVYGSFSDAGNDTFRLCIAFLSVFLFSALLVSVFTNVFTNISEAVREGHRRYRLKDHILILGAGRRLQGILDSLKDCGKPIVVMTTNKPTANGNYIYYNDERNDAEALKKAYAHHAHTIYIIGEDNEADHDTKSLQALEILQRLCQDTDNETCAQNDIHCYLTVCNHSSTEVFQYTIQKESSRLLLVDVINDYEYEAEQLMVNTDFLPVITHDSPHTSHIIIYGTTPIAHAVAYTAAHLSHYPNFSEGNKKTCITFIGTDMKQWMEAFIAARPGLFELSEYHYTTESHTPISHTPDKDSDFLDIKWQFIDAAPHSPTATAIVSQAAQNPNELLTLCVCTPNAIETALHLPRQVYDRQCNIAVYLNAPSPIIDRANATGMYGRLITFGHNGNKDIDNLFTRRSIEGKKINFIYDQAYSEQPSKSAEEAWYKIPEAHKYSSIYCANAIPLHRKCHPKGVNDPTIYEAEHRRWMMSVLLMGYRRGKKDRKHFIHEDIMPFHQLSKEEQMKDKIILERTLQP